MRGGEHEVARAYVLYRESARRSAQKQERTRRKAAEPALIVIDNGERVRSTSRT